MKWSPMKTPMDESNGSEPEIRKREKERLKEMQKLKKQKIEGILDAQIDADMNNLHELWSLLNFYQHKLICQHRILLIGLVKRRKFKCSAFTQRFENCFFF
ncbi:hypothetical protein GQ457_01G030980 [Hibiscus cannabinus]